MVIALTGTIQGQNNLLDTSTWVVGPGTTTISGFSNYGPAAENERILSTDPYGNSNVLWVSKPDGAPTNTEDGGFESSQVNIDASKTYRYTVWIKKTGSDSGYSYLGLRCYDGSGASATQRFDGTINSNPFFWFGDLPELDKWFLIVGFIHSSSYSGAHLGGIYDGVTGIQITSQSVTDYKFASGASKIEHRSILFADRNATDRQYYWNPTIYEVNGQEPTISELLNPSGPFDTQSPTAPTLSSTAQTDTTVDLSWSGATDNVGVTGYKIFKDGALEATLGNVNTYQVTGLVASTAYNFTAAALDAAGNESVVSNAVSITTNSSGGGSSGGGSSVWSEASSVASYAGDVGVGTSTVPNGYKMAIDGKLITEEVKVQLSGNWPDYVFAKDYDLPSLEEIQKHIKEKGHLPNIPSAKEVEENGIQLGEMNRLLLEKIEELTLYLLELKKENQNQQKEIEQLKLK